MYPNGIAALATDFGLPDDFQDRLNPVLPGCITLDEFIAILSATCDQDIIDALADIVQKAHCHS